MAGVKARAFHFCSPADDTDNPHAALDIYFARCFVFCLPSFQTCSIWPFHGSIVCCHEVDNIQHTSEYITLAYRRRRPRRIFRIQSNQCNMAKAFGAFVRVIVMWSPLNQQQWYGYWQRPRSYSLPGCVLLSSASEWIATGWKWFFISFLSWWHRADRMYCMRTQKIASKCARHSCARAACGRGTRHFNAAKAVYNSGIAWMPGPGWISVDYADTKYVYSNKCTFFIPSLGHGI